MKSVLVHHADMIEEFRDELVFPHGFCEWSVIKGKVFN